MFGPVDLRPDSGRRCGGAVVHGRRRDLLDRCILPMIGNPLIAICSWPKRQSRFGDRPITETIFDINTAADDCTKGSIHITKLFSLVMIYPQCPFLLLDAECQTLFSSSDKSGR
jgi:hypothetical protein